MSEQIIKKLKSKGFFSLTPLKQIDFLKEHGFFKLDVQKRISFLEQIGMFYIDVNEDPPTIPLEPDNPDLDYLKERPINAQKNRIANDWKYNFVNSAINNKRLKIEGVKGIENALSVDGGAIITCNHFNPFDSFSIEHVLQEAGSNKKLYKVSREGNFTNFPKPLNLYFKYDNLLPLSQNKETMKMFDKALSTILSRGDLVLVCPEQSMWMGYKKPKPMKYGAFKWATENDVPVIPTFITQGKPEKNEQMQVYTIHIGKAIYPDKSLPARENIQQMRNKNFEFCRKIYERTYGVPLKYDTILHEDIPKYVLSTPGFKERLNKEKIKKSSKGFELGD